MSKLEMVRISRASADQRRGRAGRIQPGVCYRLWLESEQDALPAHTPAEIWKPIWRRLPWSSPPGAYASRLHCAAGPPPAATFRRRAIYCRCSAHRPDGKITAHGRDMANIGAHPRLAHMLLRAKQLGLARLAAELAALLSERDLLRMRAQERDVDIRVRIDALRVRRHRS